ncbi:MAG: hypothetical protein QXM16_06400 [Nitrososphaerota archaeon]
MTEKRRFFADIHRMANKNRKRKSDENHHVYTNDGENFSKAVKITDIPVKAGDELYVDTIPVELTDEFVEVLRRGVKVLYLRRVTMLAKKREELGLSKNSRNDVRVMMALDPKWYREVDENFLVMRRLITAFRNSQRIHIIIVNRARAMGDAERRILMKPIKTVEEAMMELASRIVDEAGRRIPAYNKVVETLGITGENHLLAREALAELMITIDFRKGVRSIKNYLGLYRPVKGKPKYYSRSSRRALERLVMALKGTTVITVRYQLQVLKRIREVIRTPERLAGGHAG